MTVPRATPARAALLLGLLMAAAGALLASIDAITEQRIEANEQQQRQATLRELSGLDIEMSGHEDVAACDQGLVALAVVEHGYGGSMDVVAAFRDGRLSGVRVTRHGETPGFADILDPSDWIGRIDAASEVDAVTGATVTSNAVLRARDTALSRWSAETWCLHGGAPPANGEMPALLYASAVGEARLLCEGHPRAPGAEGSK